MEDIEIETAAQPKPPKPVDIDREAIPERSETELYFHQYRRLRDGSSLFSVHNVLTATTLFALDFPDDIPEDLYDEAIAAAPPTRNSALRNMYDEIYTDLLEAKAEGTLGKLLDAIRDFVDNGE